MFGLPGLLRALVALVLSVGAVFAACAPPPAAPSDAAPAGGARPAAPTAPAAAVAAPPATAPAVSSQRVYQPQPLSPPVHVMVIDPVFTPAAAIYVAVDRGYFQEEGLDVELYQSNDASASAQMLATGQAAFHPSVPDPVLFNAMARGIDVKLLAMLTVNGPDDKPAAFLVRSDHIDSGRYTAPGDLKGMIVAAPAQSSQFYVERVLSQGGLTLSDVEIVTLGLPDIVAAFASKRIDAAWNVEPLVTATVRQGLAQVIAGTGQLFPGANGGMLTMSPSFGRENPEAARRFVIAYLRGVRDYYHAFNKRDGNRAPVLESLIAHTAVKDPALYDVMGLPTFEPNGAMNPPSWDTFQDFYIRLGIQQQKVDLSKYVDLTYLNYALDRLGREP